MGALFTKEMRENRWGLALYLVGACFILQNASIHGGKECPLMVATLILLPFYAALIGASSIAGEVGAGTLSYLLTLPIPRWRIWAVKLVAPASLVGLAALGLAGICLAVDPLGTVAGVGKVSATDRWLIFAYVCGLLLILAASTFCSVLCDRTVLAALGAVVLLAGIGWCFDGEAPGAPAGLVMLLGAASLVTGAAWMFNEGELLEPRQNLWRAGVALALGLALVHGGLYTAGAIIQRTVVPPRPLHEHSLWEPTAATQLVHRADVSGALMHSVTDHLDPSGGLLRRWAHMIPLALLPNGEGFLGLDFASPHGLAQPDRGRLTVVPYQGPTVPLDETLPHGWSLGTAASPDGKHLAMNYSSRSTIVVSLSPPRAQVIPSAESVRVTSITWAATDRLVMLTCSVGVPRQTDRVEVQIQPDGRALVVSRRTLPEMFPGSILPATWHVVPGGRLHWAEGLSGVPLDFLGVVNSATGNAVWSPDGAPAQVVAISASGGRMALRQRHPGQDLTSDSPGAEIQVRDVATGQTLWHRSVSHHRASLLSPDGRKLILRGRARAGDEPSTRVIDIESGTERVLASNLNVAISVEWGSNDTILYQAANDSPRRSLRLSDSE